MNAVLLLGDSFDCIKNNLDDETNYLPTIVEKKVHVFVQQKLRCIYNCVSNCHKNPEFFRRLSTAKASQSYS